MKQYSRFKFEKLLPQINKLAIKRCTLLLGITALVISSFSALKPAAQSVFGGEVSGEVTLAHKLPIYSVETERKVVALTFDATWGADDTDIILKTLAEENIKATFFLCGYWVNNYPEAVKKIYEAGHDIGNHGNTHANGTKLSLEQNITEIQAAGESVHDALGIEMSLFRAPFGAYNAAVMSAAEQLGYYAIRWDIDSWDWMNKGVQFQVDHVVNHENLQNGSIILFHNDTRDTPEALPVIIKELRAKGYDFVPVSELIIKGDYTIDSLGRQRKQPISEDSAAFF